MTDRQTNGQTELPLIDSTPERGRVKTSLLFLSPSPACNHHDLQERLFISAFRFHEPVYKRNINIFTKEMPFQFHGVAWLWGRRKMMRQKLGQKICWFLCFCCCWFFKMVMLMMKRRMLIVVIADERLKSFLHNSRAFSDTKSLFEMLT